MNLTNAIANIHGRGYQAIDLAGWRRGYAADCKSVLQNYLNSLKSQDNSVFSNLANIAERTGNVLRTSQTLCGRAA